MTAQPEKNIGMGAMQRSSLVREMLSALDDAQTNQPADYYRSVTPPSNKAFADARVFVRTLPPELPAPTISLAADGEVNFFWDHDGVYIDLGFYGTGDYSCYATRGDQEVEIESRAASAGLPGEITNWFRA